MGTNVFGAFATIQAFYALLKVRASSRLRANEQLLPCTDACRDGVWQMTRGQAHFRSWFACQYTGHPCCWPLAVTLILNEVPALAPAAAVSLNRLWHFQPPSNPAAWSRAPPPDCLQRKVDGVKAVVTLTSSLGQMGRVSESARALDTPLGPFDTFQFAYKVSKAALNQGATSRRADHCLGTDRGHCQVLCVTNETLGSGAGQFASIQRLHKLCYVPCELY